MKFIIGWITCKPGTRDGFLERVQPMVEATRAEPGCVFFELNPKVGTADVAVLTECFRDDAAHVEHQTLPHFAPLIAELRAARLESRATYHFADEVHPM